MIPFSPPHIDESIISEVIDSLRSGWITTGPKTKALEKEIAAYAGLQNVLCVNSATSGLELMLRWFGIGKGDEVIVPAYTYSATANVVLHCGATPVMVDIHADDFNLTEEAISNAITKRTKAIIPVDFGGLPCNYPLLNELVQEKKLRKKFRPSNKFQKKLGRILILSDAAHSFGATYNGNKTGVLTDCTVFSFHAVKNLTTAEGGAICLNFPEPFDNDKIYSQLNIKSLHGQTKDALSKMEKGNWEYDIIESGYKCNMPDVLAAIGLASLRKYDDVLLPRRKVICEKYSKAFGKYVWAQLPVHKESHRESSYHLYPLRIRDINIEQRNEIIQKIFQRDVAVNVHFKPLPLLSYYRSLGYRIKDFPASLDNYSRVITLPVYPDLTDEQIQTVIQAVTESVEEVISFK